MKLIEGTVANVPPQGGRKHPQQECIQVDTSNILFICGGAFDGLEKIIKSRLNKKSIGFDKKSEFEDIKDDIEYLKMVQPQDVVKYGLIPEFTGRVPVITTLERLDEEALTKILTEPKNALIKQYKKLFAMDDVELVIEDDALKAIASIALKRGTGARGLKAVLEELMLDLMYEVPRRDDIDKVIITKDIVEKAIS